MDYLNALEEERKKILVFERELPLSLQLVTQAIETCKQKQHEMGSEEICSERPVLEEFIPLRPSYSSSDEEINNDQKPSPVNGADKKPDWLRSVHLWNNNNNQQSELRGDVVRKPIAVNATRAGGAFHPFERAKVVKAAPASSTTDNTNGGSGSGGGDGSAEAKEKEKEGHSQRKARRCWSPELHRRFLHALQQLGGSHAATPKQIRELMKVDGLTSDEVKSHLQKYRLHTRRPTTAAVQSGNSSSSSQQPHIVLVGSIWMPPTEYTAAVAAAASGQPSAADSAGAPSNGVYAPVASLPSKLSSPQKQQQNRQMTNRSPTEPINSGRRSDSDDGVRTNSDSSATSSSSQTTTASPPF